MLPDPERRLEDYGRFFFDELLRYHSRACFSRTHPWVPSVSHARCCADTPHWCWSSLALPLPVQGASDRGLRSHRSRATGPKVRYGIAAPKPHPRPQPCRTLAASALYLYRALVVGNRWLFSSSAVLGPASKADVLLEHRGWPILQRNRSEREQALLASINHFSYVGKGRMDFRKFLLRGGDQALPLEVALGTVTLHHSKRRDCSPAICSRQPACGLPGGPELHYVRMANRTRNRNPLYLALSLPLPQP